MREEGKRGGKANERENEKENEISTQSKQQKWISGHISKNRQRKKVGNDRNTHKKSKKQAQSEFHGV